MKKTLVFVCILIALGSDAQDCKNFYYLQNNRTIEISIYDKKGDMSGKLVYKIADVKNSGAVTTSNVQSQMLDKKGKTIANGSSIMKCNAGVMMIDMKMNIPLPQAEQFKQYNAKAEDFYMEYPVQMKSGDQLKDGNFTMDVDNNGMQQSLTMTVTDRRVEGMEKISTSAGTWECYKISYKSKMSIKMMGVGIPMNMDGTEWYAPGFGVVKSQSKHGGTEITAIK